MKTVTPADLSGVDDRLLDRLVDGELDGPERAELLRRLDAEPGAWRRCAVAFLEAQAWRHTLRDAPALDLSTPAKEESIAFPMWRTAGRLTGLAAAITVAFLTGFIARSGLGPQRDDQPYAVVKQADGRPSVQKAETIGGSRSAQPLGLYASEAGALDAEGGEPSRPPALPEYVRRQLERQGYEVQEDRKLISVALRDGRRVTVPVEAYKYRFVGHRVH
jgi:hypothetical protein